MTLKPNPNWRGDPTFIPELFRLWGVNFRELPGWDQWGMGDFGPIQGVFWHHTGARNTPATYIARNTGLNGALSSLAHTAPNGLQTLCGVGIAYHAGRGDGHGWPRNNANPLSLGFEMQHNGTDPWPEAQLESTRLATAAILWFLGHPATPRHMIGHWEYSLQAQGKWDPGKGNGVPGALMDMNAERRKVQALIDNPPFLRQKESPIVQQIIDQVRYIFGQLSPWAQLGHDAQGRPLTLVDGVAALRRDVAGLRQELHDLAALINSSKGA